MGFGLGAWQNDEKSRYAWIYMRPRKPFPKIPGVRVLTRPVKISIRAGDDVVSDLKENADEY